MKRNKAIALGSAGVLVAISSSFAAFALSEVASPSNSPVLAGSGTEIVVLNRKHILKAPKAAATMPATSVDEVAVGEVIVMADLGATEPETVGDSTQPAASAVVFDVKASRAATSPSPTPKTSVARPAQPKIVTPVAAEPVEATDEVATANYGPSSSTAPTTAARRTTTTAEGHSQAPATTSAPRTVTTAPKNHEQERETHEASGHDS
jgi:hypothetical protein